MAPHQRTANADRFSTLASWAGVVLALLHLATAFRAWPDVVPALLDRAVVALVFVAGGFAVAWVGSYLGNLLWRVNDLSRQMSSTAADRNAEVRQILDRLETLVTASKGAAAEQPAPNEAPDVPEVLADPLPAAAAAGSCGPSAASALSAPGMNERVVELLEEIREVALMDDEQRRARLQQHLDARRRAGLDQVFTCIAAGQWAAADQALCGLEARFAADASVRQARGQFLRQRAEAEPDALFQTEQRVRDLVQVGSFDRAIATATEFVNNFPASADGRHLLTEVYREYEVSRDTTFQRLYEQVQANVDRRQWRAALADAQRLLEQFPTHARAHRIRRELKTIATNAEIEERQEQELRIQLLVRNRRFAEAVELAEEVVRRFPESPQADALEERLPQLRELAEHGGGNGI